MGSQTESDDGRSRTAPVGRYVARGLTFCAGVAYNAIFNDGVRYAVTHYRRVLMLSAILLAISSWDLVARLVLPGEPLRAPLPVSLNDPRDFAGVGLVIFVAAHDLVALGLALITAYRFHPSMGVATVGLFVATHVPFFVFISPFDAPGLLRLVLLALAALVGIRVVAKLRGSLLPVGQRDRELTDGVAERKRSEAQARESAERNRVLVESATDAIVTTDETMHIISWNRAARALFDWQDEEVVGNSFGLLVPERISEPMLSGWDQKVSGPTSDGRSRTVEAVGIKKDGSEFPAETSYGSWRAGGKRYVTAAVRDITERKRAEEAQSRLTSILESTTDLVGMANASGNIFYLNRTGREMLGIGPEEDLAGSRLSDFHAEPARQSVLDEAIKTAIRDGTWSGESELRHRDGRKVPVSQVIVSHKLPDGTVDFISTIARDISARRRASKEVRRLALAVSTIGDGVTVIDPGGCIEFVNPAMERMLGYGPHELVGSPAFSVYLDGPYGSPLWKIMQGLHTGAWSGEAELIGKYGERVPVLEMAAPMRDESGDLVGYVCTHKDIRERKEAEEALRKSEEEARELAHENAVVAYIGRINSSSLEAKSIYERFADQVRTLIPFDRIGINTIDSKAGTYTRAYGAGLRIPEKPPEHSVPLQGTLTEEAIRTPSGMLIQAQDPEEIVRRFPPFGANVRAGLRSAVLAPMVFGSETIGVLQLETTTLNAYTQRHLALAEQVSSQIAGAVANSRLIEKSKRTEEQLLQAQKMQSIGTLVGGIAHDINNLLSPIIGYAELAAKSLPESDERMREFVQQIQKAGQRAAGLVHQLLAFSLPQIIAPKVINLNELMLDLNTMLRRLISENIELVTLPAPNLHPIRVDPGRVEQVLVNLVVNARDAMPEGGKLVIETENVTVNREFAERNLESGNKECVRLSVSDTGVGMTPEVKTHIFEPFFTTKEVGKGTGLGLSTCYGIVKQSGGYIAFTSEADQGTTFRIYLPAAKGSRPEVTVGAGHEDLDMLPGGWGETLMVVEDEPSLRRLMTEVLREEGYTVLEAANGVDAMRMLEEQSDASIDLLLSDLVMPQMGGRDLADRFKSLRPQARVLFTSGYADDKATGDVSEPGTEFIAKPFTATVLAQTVRRVLG